VLSYPSVYRLFKRLMADSNKRDVWLAERQIRASAGDRILDIGCGPGHLLDVLPAVSYVGFDLSEAYVEAARAHYGERGHFFHASVSDPPRIEFGTFDIVMAKGVLHHLDDDEATSMFDFSYRALRVGGRLVTFDGCFVEGQSPIARFLLRRDRGLYVRSREQYEQLARKAFPAVHGIVKHDLLRVPYTHLVLQCARGDESYEGVMAGEGERVQSPREISHHD